ncbi:MAG: DUF542 domain-containing protein [Polyangiaceae bacterium]
MIHAEVTVGDLAARVPGADRVFEKLGIDYCCGGSHSLREACLEAHASLSEALALLERAEAESAAIDHPAPAATLGLGPLLAHILETHHRPTWIALARLDALAAKVAQVHEACHPELRRVSELTAELRRELEAHMRKEENVLGPPRVPRPDGAGGAGAGAWRAPPFGTAQNPIRCMLAEHDSTGSVLRQLRTVSGGYQVPGDACASYRALYEGLEDLEADIHQHIHLENNVLFPRALGLESQARDAASQKEIPS